MSNHFPTHYVYTAGEVALYPGFLLSFQSEQSCCISFCSFSASSFLYHLIILSKLIMHADVYSIRIYSWKHVTCTSASADAGHSF